MHPQAKDTFVKKLIEIVGNITTILPHSEPYNLAQHNLIMLSESLALVDDVADQYEKLRDQILDKLRSGEKVSEETISKALRHLVVSLHKESDLSKTSSYFNQFVSNFENYSDEQTVYVPLESIELHSDSFDIGRVTFIKMTDMQIDEIMGKIEETIMSSEHPSENKPLIIQNLRQLYVEPFRGKVCAVFRFVAEPEIARARAEEECRRVIDLLRYAIPFIYDRLYPAYWSPRSVRQDLKNRHKTSEKASSKDNNRTYIGVGLQGEVGIGTRQILILPSKTNGFNWQGQYVGVRPFVVSEEHIKIMEEAGVFKVAEILQKEDVTTFEEVLLRGIHWFANAMTQFEVENELLDLVTCLETLLTNTTGELMDAVAYGIAFMLAIGVDERRDYIERYKQIYKIRCLVSHHGHRKVGNIDIIELRHASLNVIRFLINKLDEWKEQKDIFNWIETQKLK